MTTLRIALALAALVAVPVVADAPKVRIIGELVERTTTVREPGDHLAVTLVLRTDRCRVSTAGLICEEVRVQCPADLAVRCSEAFIGVTVVAVAEVRATSDAVPELVVTRLRPQKVGDI